MFVYPSRRVSRMIAARRVGRTAVPLQDQPLTVNTVGKELMQAQAINDFVVALQFVNILNAYTLT